MTSDKRRKAQVRARMAKTGERRTTARRHLFGAGPDEPIVDGFRLRGGQHPDSAALAAVLAHAGVTSREGSPLSEAMLFGIMGGLGAGYILWEFEHDGGRVVTLGFRNQWQYHDRAVRTALGRLGIDHDVRTTSGAKTAARHLDEQLDDGRPALIWPDRGTLGYWQLPPHLEGHGGHVVVAYGRDGDRVRIDDRTSAPLTADRATLDRARARVGSYRNLLIAARPTAGAIDDERLTTAVIDGIDDCVAQLSGGSTSFALPAWRKWARLVTDPRNAKGWPQVFDDGVGLCGALLSVWEGTSASGMTGGHLRDLYVDFLEESAPLIGMDVGDAASALREAARRWRELGDVVTDGQLFARMRALTATIRHAIAAGGDEGAGEAARAGRELWELRTGLDATRPLPADEIDERFRAMGTKLHEIHALEVAAVDALARARTSVG